MSQFEEKKHYHIFMDTRRHLELKISYYRHLLTQMPHGGFVSIGGKRTVQVFYIPGCPEVTRNHKKRFRVDTKVGTLWSDKILRYLEVKKKLDDLMKEWRMYYAGNPNADAYSASMNSEAKLSAGKWESLRSEQNNISRNSPMIYKGQHFRSKNEIIACQIIEEMGYQFKTEVEIRDVAMDRKTGNMREVLLFPDVSFLVPEINKIVMLEIDGAMDNDDYRVKAEMRRKNYIESGFEEGRDVLFYRISSGGGIDADTLREIIEHGIVRNLPR